MAGVTPPPGSGLWTGGRTVLLALAIAAVGGLAGAAMAALLSDDLASMLWPTWLSIVVFLLFTAILRWQIGGNVFGELGFLYAGLATAYTVLPGLAFVFVGVREEELLAQLAPATPDLAAHLWRHVLFVSGVAVGYLLARGREALPRVEIGDPEDLGAKTVALLIGTIAVSILFLTLMSAPVAAYIDHYTRYDHLSWLPRKAVSVVLRFKLGLYSVLLTFLFLGYRRFRAFLPFVVAAICLYEISYSVGSRIESLIILLVAACLYTHVVEPLTIGKGLAALGSLAVLFSLVELVRAAEGSPSQLEIRPASEFGAVFLTSFHLYAERARGALPETEWPMFFNDFTSLFTFSDFVRWNPQDWYARNYFPEAVVAPQTLGPIADSAIWGGELDLLLRSLVNGVFFAFLVRWFLARRERWWAVTVYVYCYATSVLTLKYSVFYHLVPLLKTLLPTMLAVGAMRGLLRPRHRPGPDVSPPGAGVAPAASR